jgi:hypothetical protein
VKDDDRNNEPLDTILRRAMRAQPGPATPECADAEALAAYSDRSSSAAERERLETHFADCMRCQLVLADIARADESARDARAAAEVPWYRRWRIAIPALAAVGAIFVFIAIRRPPNEEPQSNEVVATAKREAPAVELAVPEPAAAPEMPDVASAPAPAAPAPAPASAPPASDEIAMDEAQAPAAAAPRAQAKDGTALHRNLRSSAALAPRAMVAPASPAAAPALPPVNAGRVVAIAPAAPVVEKGAAPVAQPAPLSKELAMNQPQPETAQLAGSTGYAAPQLNGKAAAPGNGAMVAAPERAAPALAGDTVSQSETAVGGAALGAGSGAIAGAVPGGGASAVGAAAGAGAPIPWSPQPRGELANRPAEKLPPGMKPGFATMRAIWPRDKSVTWIVDKNGTIQKFYANGAMRWQYSGVTTDLITGWAPSATVCWVIGRSGTIIRTTDGGDHWELITTPTADNLRMVVASSAKDATITTERGQSFATSDGGASWHRQ